MRTPQQPAPDSPAGLVKTAWRSDGIRRDREAELVAAVEAVQRLKARVAEQESQLVFELRNSGASWQRIADVTGMASRQAAQHRYEQSAGLVDRLNQAMGRKPKP